MAKLTKTQQDEIYTVLRHLMKDESESAYNTLSNFYVKYAPSTEKK